MRDERIYRCLFGMIANPEGMVLRQDHEAFVRNFCRQRRPYFLRDHFFFEMIFFLCGCTDNCSVASPIRFGSPLPEASAE